MSADQSRETLNSLVEQFVWQCEGWLERAEALKLAQAVQKRTAERAAEIFDASYELHRDNFIATDFLEPLRREFNLDTEGV